MTIDRDRSPATRNLPDPVALAIPDDEVTQPLPVDDR